MKISIFRVYNTIATTKSGFNKLYIYNETVWKQEAIYKTKPWLGLSKLKASYLNFDLCLTLINTTPFIVMKANSTDEWLIRIYTLRLIVSFEEKHH